MKPTERRQYQARFAEKYVELASQLHVFHDDLIVGLRSHIAADAIKQSGYPIEQKWMAADRANALLRHDFVQSEIKRLAQDRLAADPSPHVQVLMEHLVRCGRVSLPDYEKIFEQIGVPVEILREFHMNNQLAEFYRWKRRELELATELSMTVEQFEQSAAEHGVPPEQFYDQKMAEKEQTRQQEMWAELNNASRVWTFLKKHDICSAFQQIMDDEIRATVLVDLIRNVAERHVWLIQLAKEDPKELPYIEEEIRELMVSADITWEEAAARVQADWEAYKQREREQTDEDTKVEQFVRTLPHEMTLKQIKEATGHRNIITMGRICKSLADQSVIEPLPRYYRVDTRVVPIASPESMRNEK